MSQGHGSLPEGQPTGEDVLDYLWAMREAQKEDSMEPSWSHTIDNTAKPKLTSFFPLWKLKGTQESAEKDEGVDSEDPDGNEGVTEEFMVCLARAMKDAQKEEKHCYHCSSLDHFICDCPLVKASRMNSHLNHKEGTAPKKGAWAPQMKVTTLMMPPEGAPKA